MTLLYPDSVLTWPSKPGCTTELHGCCRIVYFRRYQFGSRKKMGDASYRPAPVFFCARKHDLAHDPVNRIVFFVRHNVASAAEFGNRFEINTRLTPSSLFRRRNRGWTAGWRPGQSNETIRQWRKSLVAVESRWGLCMTKSPNDEKFELGPHGINSPPPWRKPNVRPSLLRALRTYSHSVPCTDKSRSIPGLSLGYRPYSNFWANSPCH